MESYWPLVAWITRMYGTFIHRTSCLCQMRVSIVTWRPHYHIDNVRSYAPRHERKLLCDIPRLFGTEYPSPTFRSQLEDYQLTYATYLSIFQMIVTGIFRPMLHNLQPNSRTPVDYRKAFLMTREMVFMCVVTISIGCFFVTDVPQSSSTCSSLPSSSANRHRRAFALFFQDQVHLRCSVICYYATAAQSPTLVN
jgi:hypothetical protein